MGFGDDLMATGMARGAAARGKRIAFGDRNRIYWGPHSKIIFQGNPNIAPPGSERSPGLEWIKYYKGHRIYNRQEGDRWLWHPEKFKAMPGEIFFTEEERNFAKSTPPGFILIEPNVPPQKAHGVNKQWPIERFQTLASEFKSAGYRVIQPNYARAKYHLRNATLISTPTFRHAMALLSRARLAILPEGGLHHGAAALGIKAVVLFGGFIPPSVTGYDMHVNLTGGAEACGSLKPCEHCRAAMDAITAEDVLKAADGILNG